MQAVHVKVLPPTDHNPKRWKVRCRAFDKIVSANSCPSPHSAFRCALEEFQSALEKEYGQDGPQSVWDGPWVEGQIHDGTSVFVNLAPLGIDWSEHGVDGLAVLTD